MRWAYLEFLPPSHVAVCAQRFSGCLRRPVNRPCADDVITVGANYERPF